MALGNTTQYGADIALRQAFAPGFETMVFDNLELMNLAVNGQPAFQKVQCESSGGYEWKMHSAGNSSVEIFTEGGAQPQAVAQTYVNCVVAPTYFRAMVQISGHVRDIVANGAIPAGLNVVTNEFELGMLNLKNLINTTFIGSGTNGLETAIDSATNYAGLTRSSYSGFQSTETALSGALTAAHLQDQLEFSSLGPKGGKTGVILMPHNQITNYINLMGAVAASNTSVRVEISKVGGSSLDYSPLRTGLSFAGVPIIAVNDMTTTVILGLDLSPGKNLWAVMRDFEVMQMPHSGDDNIWQLSHASVPVIKNPRKDWKSTGVTA